MPYKVQIKSNGAKWEIYDTQSGAVLDVVDDEEEAQLLMDTMNEKNGTV